MADSERKVGSLIQLFFISSPAPEGPASSEESHLPFPSVPSSVGTHGNLYICIEHTVQ